ncbi:MAG: hypothetical protein ACLQEQ_08295 [Nitrososphaerales archaeon]
MIRWGVRLASAIGLIFGVATTLIGLQDFCGCHEQTVGPAGSCFCSQSLSLLVIVGVSIVIVSAVCLAFSFLKSGTTLSGTPD